MLHVAFYWIKLWMKRWNQSNWDQFLPLMLSPFGAGELETIVSQHNSWSTRFFDISFQYFNYFVCGRFFDWVRAYSPNWKHSFQTERYFSNSCSSISKYYMWSVMLHPAIKTIPVITKLLVTLVEVSKWYLQPQ